jgi:hypothetical protein
MKIDFCKLKQVPKLMSFLDQHWSRGHVLSYSRKLFDWQHSGTADREVDFIIAVNDDEIVGCLGFILNSRFDRNLESKDTVWLTTWKSISEKKLTGLQLHNFLTNSFKNKSIGTVGLSKTVIPLYKGLKYKVGDMDQLYLTNKKIKDFFVAKFPRSVPEVKKISSSADFSLIQINQKNVEDFREIFYDFQLLNLRPVKTLDYLIQKYLKNPFYNYKLFLIKLESNYPGWLVVRPIKVKSSLVLRVVDCLLDESVDSGFVKQLEKLLEDYHAEYIDIFCTGDYSERLKKSGMSLVDPSSSMVIIPNYFEPFNRKNCSMHYAFKGVEEVPFYLHKADADQDRPNIL